MSRAVFFGLLVISTGALALLLLTPAISTAFADGCCGVQTIGEGTGGRRVVRPPPIPRVPPRAGEGTGGRRVIIPPTRMRPPAQQQIRDRLNRRGITDRRTEPSDISRQTGLTDDEIRRAAEQFGMPEDDFRTILDEVRNPANFTGIADQFDREHLPTIGLPGEYVFEPQETPAFRVPRGDTLETPPNMTADEYQRVLDGLGNMPPVLGLDDPAPDTGGSGLGGSNSAPAPIDMAQAMEQTGMSEEEINDFLSAIRNPPNFPGLIEDDERAQIPTISAFGDDPPANDIPDDRDIPTMGVASDTPLQAGPGMTPAELEDLLLGNVGGSYDSASAALSESNREDRTPTGPRRAGRTLSSSEMAEAVERTGMSEEDINQFLSDIANPASPAEEYERSQLPAIDTPRGNTLEVPYGKTPEEFQRELAAQGIGSEEDKALARWRRDTQAVIDHNDSELQHHQDAQTNFNRTRTGVGIVYTALSPGRTVVVGVVTAAAEIGVRHLDPSQQRTGPNPRPDLEYGGIVAREGIGVVVDITTGVPGTGAAAAEVFSQADEWAKQQDDKNFRKVRESNLVKNNAGPGNTGRTQ